MYARPVTHAAFFACLPPPPAKLHIRSLCQHLKSDVGWGVRTQEMRLMHISLVGVCSGPSLPPAVIDRARTAATTIAMQAFEVVFDYVAGSRRWVLRDGNGAKPLRALQAALVGAMADAGLAGHVGSEPHLTLSYDACDLPTRSVPSIRWMMDEFVLIHSLYGLSLHKQLGSWRLQHLAQRKV
jgi:2'-5' RNA ligase